MRIPHMKDWPNLPTPYRTRNWQETARKVTLLSLDDHAGAPHFPVTAYFDVKEPLSGGFQGENFGTATYLRENNQMTRFGEAVAQLAAVLTAAMTDGMDPRNLNGRDYVKMAQAYFSRTPDGRGFVSNNTPVSDCPGSFWYTLYPTCLYLHLAAQYPEDKVLEGHVREIADTWLSALSYIDTWDMMGVSLAKKQLVKGGHTEPEGIIGAAYVFLMAYSRLKEEKYLDAAKQLMKEAAQRSHNPYYEIVGSYAPVIAARLNAEENAGLPLGRMLDWVFTDGTNTARSGWGVINSRWGDYDAYGLSGSLTDTTGYAFAMNTFVTAGALAPVARYAPWYSHDLGKYLTAVASNSHMFFGDGLPKELQDDGDYAEKTGLGYLVYEGVRNKGKTTPFATGDAKSPRRPGGTNFSFYSSGPLGMLSSIIMETNVPEILCFDLLKTDFEHGKAYPAYLLYNPLGEEKQVIMPLPGEGACDVFDAAGGAYLCRNVQGKAVFMMAPDTAVQPVILPAGAEIFEKDGCIFCGDTPIRYAGEWADLPCIRDNDVIRGEKEICPKVHLASGDRVKNYRLSFLGKDLAKGEELPACWHFAAGEIPSGSGALILEIETEKGRKISCSKGLRVMPEGGRVRLHYQGDQLFDALESRGNCTLEKDERGLRMKLHGDWEYIPCPMLHLRADQKPLIMIDVPYCWGGWGLVGRIGEKEYYIQGDSAGEGIFLYDLGALMQQWGEEEADIEIRLIITAGPRSQAIVREIMVIES